VPAATMAEFIALAESRLPFMLPRLDRNMPTQLTELQRPLGAYLRENVHYTFAGLALSAISALASRRWCLACGSPGRC
jgi:hypothetical protein